MRVATGHYRPVIAILINLRKLYAHPRSSSRASISRQGLSKVRPSFPRRRESRPLVVIHRPSPSSAVKTEALGSEASQPSAEDHCHPERSEGPRRCPANVSHRVPPCPNVSHRVPPCLRPRPPNRHPRSTTVIPAQAGIQCRPKLTRRQSLTKVAPQEYAGARRREPWSILRDPSRSCARGCAFAGTQNSRPCSGSFGLSNVM